MLPENDPKRPDLVWNKMKEPDIDIDEITSLFAIKKKEIAQSIKKEKIMKHLVLLKSIDQNLWKKLRINFMIIIKCQL